MSYDKKKAMLKNAAAIAEAYRIVIKGEDRVELSESILKGYSGFGGLKEVLNLDLEFVKQHKNVYPTNEPDDKYGLIVLSHILNTIAANDEELNSIIESIKTSVLTAFYTPTTVINAVRDAVQHTLDVFGIKADSMLETSAGIGGFLPVATAGCRKVAIEKDYVSSLILSALNPDTETFNCKFEDIDELCKQMNTPNRYDIVASNIPFGDIPVSDFKFSQVDADHKHATQRLHTYFFMKGMEQLENGGILAFITSRGVADSQDNQYLREWMVRNGHLLAAYRLPDNLFMDGSGVEVGSDLIIFQRDINKKWQTEHEQMFAQTKNKVVKDVEVENVNALLSLRSYAIYTDMNVKRNQFGKMKMVYKWSDTEEELCRVLTDRLSRSMERTFRKSAWLYGHDTLRKMFAEMEARYNANSRNAKKMREAAEKKRELQERIRPHYDAVKDAYNQLMSWERMNKKPNAVMRYTLNEAYDKMVNEVGTFHSNIKVLDKSFDEVNMMMSLEYKNPDGTITKADVFTKPVAYRIAKDGETLTPMEALSVSLNERGTVDMPYIESLSKMLMEDVYEELRDEIFLTPWGWQHKTKLINGNVVEKKEQVIGYFNEHQEKDIFTENCLNDTINALEKARPALIKYDDIDIQFGVRWLPSHYFQDFCKYAFDMNGNYDHCEITYVGMDMFTVNMWTRSDKSRAYRYKNDQLDEVVTYALADSVPTFTKTFRDKKFKDTERIRAVQKIVTQLRKEFVEYMHSDHIKPEQRDEIVKMYNDKFNCYVKPNFDGSLQTFPGLKFKYEYYQSQKDCIWMCKQNNGVVGWHEVGAGKTQIMISASFEMHRLGLCNKPLIIGMKANVQQIAEAYRESYPDARILYPSEKDFSKENRAELFRKIANNDWDCIILSHNQFDKIPQSSETEIRLIEDELNDIEEALKNLNDSDYMNAQVKRRIRKQKETMEAKLLDLRAKASNKKDYMITFREMGIDHIFVDEYHEFKNLQFATKHTRVAGIGNNRGSEKAWNLLVAIRDIQFRRNSDMCASFFSGTIISNALTELYVLFKYLRPRELRRQNLGCFDAWAANFTHKSIDYDLTITGEIKAKERFRTYCNVPELSMFLREITDYRTAEMINLDRPKANVIFDSQPPTEEQAELIKKLCKFAESGDWSVLGLPESKRPNKIDKAVMLIATDVARKISLDPRMLDEEMFHDDDNNKSSRCAANIAEYYFKYNAHKGTQFVFCDISTPNSDGKWNIYDDIRDKLERDFGIPRQEVAFVHDYDTDKKREKLFADMNSGNIRVLFGSTKKLGTGVNAQERAVAVHHLDIPWRPSDLEQRDGRAVRKGNMVKEWGNNTVDVIIYGTERTLDAYKFSLLKNKAQFINQINSGTTGVRTFDEDSTCSEDDGMNFAEYVAILSGNDDLLKKAKLDNKIASLESDADRHRRDMSFAKDQVEEDEIKIDGLQKALNRFESDLNDIVPLYSKGEGLYVIGAETQDMEGQAKKLRAYREEHNSSEELEIGSYCGMKVFIRSKYNCNNKLQRNEFLVKAPKSNMRYMCNEHGGIGVSNEDAVHYFDGLPTNIERLIENNKNNIAYYSEQLEQHKFVASQPWEGQDELDALIAERNELQARIDKELDEKEKIKQENVSNGHDEEA